MEGKPSFTIVALINWVLATLLMCFGELHDVVSSLQTVELPEGESRSCVCGAGVV
jgi:hypothetical protein